MTYICYDYSKVCWACFAWREQLWFSMESKFGVRQIQFTAKITDASFSREQHNQREFYSEVSLAWSSFRLLHRFRIENVDVNGFIADSHSQLSAGLRSVVRSVNWGTPTSTQGDRGHDPIFTLGTVQGRLAPTKRDYILIVQVTFKSLKWWNVKTAPPSGLTMRQSFSGC